jgi:RHS repeat-associated protein
MKSLQVLLVVTLLTAISFVTSGQTPIIFEYYSCLNETQSQFTHDAIAAEASDNGICSGLETSISFVVSGDTQLANVTSLDPFDRTPTINVSWQSNQPGVLIVDVYYRKWIQKITGCTFTALRYMYTYKIYRQDTNPSGTITGNTTLVASNPENGVTFNLSYLPDSNYPQDLTATKIQYFNGTSNIETDIIKTNSTYVPTAISFTASSVGTHSLVLKVQDGCNKWYTLPAQQLTVLPSCYQDNATSASIGIIPQIQPFSDGSIKVNANQPYTLAATGITDFAFHYDWNALDGGQDVVLNGNSFTILKDLGSYRITAVPKAGRESCPTPAPLQLVLGGGNVLIQQPCAIIFPDDLSDFGYEIGSENFVLQHFAVTAKSDRSITVLPGVTLDFGADLIIIPTEPKPIGDPTKNYVEQVAYDEYGRVISSSRNYFDDRGLSIQSQYKNLSKGVVMANQTLYDALGRPVISTLSAPVAYSNDTDDLDDCNEAIAPGENVDFAFKPDFVKASATENYGYEHFDLTHEESPVPVDASSEGTLGWYYSANNGTSTNSRINEPLVAATQYPYSRTLFHHDGSGNAKGSTKPGNIFKAGGGYVATSNEEPVDENDVYLDKYLTMRQVEIGFQHGFIEGQYFRSVSIDGSGKKSVAYSDKSGNTIISLYFGTHSTPITKSYQFFDLAGRLKVSVSPNGVQQYERTEDPVPFDQIDKTSYFHNNKGWLDALEETDTEKSEPVKNGRTEYVYRKDGKIRFSQNAKQRIVEDTKDEVSYSYTNYDDSGRPLESGEYIVKTGGVTFKSAGMLDILESVAPDGGLVEANGNKRDKVKTFYDEPDPEIALETGSTLHRSQRFVNGAVSRTRKDDYFTTWYSYDERGRVEWMIQNIKDFGTKTIDYRYGPTGQVQEVLYQKNSPQERFSHFYEYDADGRLFKAYSTRDELQYNKKGELTNAASLKLQATYFYYLHGPLKRVELADDVQGIDYVYTVDGALKSINNGNADVNATAGTTKDPGKDGFGNNFKKDVFGMTLEYFNGDYSSSAIPSDNVTLPVAYPEQHTGMIRAMRWHSPTESAEQFGYAFNYDQRNQFSSADWGSVTGSSMTIKDDARYHESISGYDLNGNIDVLNRKNSKGDNIAHYKYQYITNTNKLDKILDIDNNNAVVKDYEYNEIGELKSETGAEEKHIEYDVTGKVRNVFRDASKTKLATSFVYDDKGFRLSKTSYDKNGAAQFRTWYVRDGLGSVLGTYEEDISKSQSPVITELPVYASGRIGLYKPQFDYTMYELTDHLGNVRAVIGKPLEVEYLATMESERESKESKTLDGDFLDIDPVPTSTDYNHTPAAIVVNGVSENIANPNEVNRLNNRPNGELHPAPIGTGIMLWVHPGDVIDAEVFVKYANFTPSNQNVLGGLAAFLASGFGAGPTGIDGASIFSIVDQPEFAALPAWGHLDDEQPRAFLNYLLFDNNFKLQDFNFDQVTSAAEITATPAPHEQLALGNISIKKEGFIYIYVSNQSDQNMEVYFDDLKVKHTYSEIVAGSDFYPFGLTIEDRQIQRELYRHGYQGQFAEKDDETGWNHFELREYDPEIGRWIQKDPASQYHSPYIAMGNNSITSVDPSGGIDHRFDANGNYLGSANDVWWHNILFGVRGVVVDGNGDITQKFRFSHFTEDNKSLKEGNIKKLIFVKDDEIIEMLANAGAFNKENRERPVDYLLKEGKGGGEFDFAHDGIYDMYQGSSPSPNKIPSRYLFLVENIAYNQSNFGNFMFGAGVVTLRTPAPYMSALLGAHYNSLINSKANGYPTQLDSKDDQWSIFRGANYALFRGFNLKGR